MTEEQMNDSNTQSMKFRYAGFWMRFWAYLVDLIIVFSINGILLVPFKFINDGFTMDIGFWTVTGILSSIVFYLYFLLMTKFYNQTLGKMIFGLRVIREDSQSLRWNDLIFREIIGRFIHRVFFIGVFLYLFVAFGAQKQGIHDMIGNTRVVFEE
ncbi:RDD family protein [Gracilibacillus thailandensis]|uniref:RDD family protein n=1 Tax=Gracilibacillus thailandensis TaxID=563735 RepID=A0A6N7R3E2_9BACI|nr:RDD family protein [Gracilibacillus thailandensis]MRI67466.1 RDD family protein [Gracilibacillus thailandensis]